MKLQMFKLDLDKAEQPEIKLPTPTRSLRKQDWSSKTPTCTLLTTSKPLTMWITTNCGKFFKRWDYQTTLPASSETRMQVKKQQLELDMEQPNGSKLGKEFIKAVYCYPAYLSYMWSRSCKMPGWMNHNLEPRCQEKYQQLQICIWYHPNGRKRRGTKDLLMKVKEESEKASLKLNIQKK